MATPYGSAFDPSASGEDNPLSAAVGARDRNVIDMVRNALERKEAFLLFQPIVDCGDTRRVAFYESLIRVSDDTGRTIPAKDFIMQVENTETGRIIDCLALEIAMRTLRERSDIRLSVNMSARSMGYMGWSDTYFAGLKPDPTIADRLIIEITESSAIEMPDITRGFMDRVQATGASFALDDFGAGYTSFRYLKEFLFDVIKIDQYFVRDIHRDADNRAIVATLIQIANHFDMFCVVEGVETEEEATCLRAMGADCLQGFLYGHAATLPPVEKQRKKWTRFG
jgi:EAL domain-containing protein (putative c-di-GMP-specific phosphodiesterase class I)